MISREPTGTSSFANAFGAALTGGVEHRQRLAAETAAAPELLARLEAQPRSRRKLLVRNSRRYRSWVLARRLIQKSHETCFADPAESLALAELAADVADRLPAESYGPGTVEDLKGSAWAQAANAHRILHELKRSEESFAIAEYCLAQGSGDPLEMARLADLKASLRRAQRRLNESESLIDQAVEIYRVLGDDHMVGRSLIKKGSTLIVGGEMEKAVAALQTGLSLVDAEREPRTLLAGQHNLVGSLAECGRFDEARAQLEELCNLHQEHGDKISLLRLLWVKGRIAVGLESYGEAEVALNSAQRGFLRHSQGYTAAVISLDLADLFARQGRTAELKTLAGEMYPIFQAKDIHREAIAALLLFRQALEEERASLELIHGLRTFLNRARSNPRLRYAGPPRSGARPGIGSPMKAATRIGSA